jgi:hypothetical protein
MFNSTVSPITENISEELAEPEEVVEVLEMTGPIVPEITVEDPEPVPVVDPEPEQVRTQSFNSPDPVTPSGWILPLIQAAGVSEYQIDVLYESKIDYEIAGTVAHLEEDGRIPQEIFDNGVAIPIFEPTGIPLEFQGAINYKLDIRVENGGTQTLLTEKEPVPIEWIYDPPEITVTAEQEAGNLIPPKYTIKNVGELPLLVSTIEVDDNAYTVDWEILAGASVVIEADDPMLATEDGTHVINIYSNDPVNPIVTDLYLIDIPVIDPSFAIIDYDAAAGIGSEIFGPTLEFDTLGEEYTVTSWIEATSDGTKVSPDRVDTINSGEDGLATLKLALDILFTGSPDELYQYVVEIVDAGGVSVFNWVSEPVTLNHWSNFVSLSNQGDAWGAVVEWNEVTVEGAFSVFMCLRYWDASAGENGELYDVYDGDIIEENKAVTSKAVDSAEGETDLTLTKPATRTIDTANPVTDGDVWMNAYGSGYYFFTYMTLTDGGTWYDRIGCPPEAI